MLTIYGHTGGYTGATTFWYYLAEKDTYLTLHANSAIKAAVQQQILIPLILFLTERDPAEN